MAETEEAAAGQVADEQAVDEQVANEKEKAKITELQGWHREKEAASRHNRNLLQYAGALAAVLGIQAGSGGIFAIAIALMNAGPSLPDWLPSIPQWVTSLPEAVKWVFVGVGIAGAAAPVALLVIFLIRALRYRQEAERQADDHRHNLIAIDPTLFPLEKE